jgi:hypothetical protein
MNQADAPRVGEFMPRTISPYRSVPNAVRAFRNMVSVGSHGRIRPLT